MSGVDFHSRCADLGDFKALQDLVRDLRLRIAELETDLKWKNIRLGDTSIVLAVWLKASKYDARVEYMRAREFTETIIAGEPPDGARADLIPLSPLTDLEEERLRKDGWPFER